uniref:serine/threonine-protein kinase ULK3-like isoform X1 n=1 Tax=Styela clava TaxID=7725 RepID=UPI00193A6FDD|nr:serine/threonine-protein kinase ULK3-like isoform X1 [Styela clava]
MNPGNSKLSEQSLGLKTKPHQQPNLDGFVFTKRLGSGTYANVYKAYKKSSDQREVHAIKCIKKSSLNRASMENLLVEIEILKQIDHPHIVKMLDFQWDSNYIYIIMEYCSGGDLSRFISTRRMLPEFFVKRFLQQIASALQLLHNHNISHMDLKPQNILLTSEEQPVLKVADFGFAQYLESSVVDTLKGSPLYMAPEIITQRRYNAKVDLWSIGVILYECLYGRAPFASNTFVELENKIKSDKPIELPSYPRTSDECSALLYGLLQRDPDDRISFDEFFLHPFVDLEHKPSPECLTKATSVVTKAVERDKEGKKEEAAKLYGDAIEYFVPAIYYETDKRKKEVLRQKVKEYMTRAEILSQVSNHNDSCKEQSKLVQYAQSKPEVMEALQMFRLAQNKAGQDNLQEAMDLYEKALEALISLSKVEKDTQLKKSLHDEIEIYLKRAEDVREKLRNSKDEKEKPASSQHRKPRFQVIMEEDDHNTKTRFNHWTTFFVIFVAILFGVVLKLEDIWMMISTR